MRRAVTLVALSLLAACRAEPAAAPRVHMAPAAPDADGGSVAPAPSDADDGWGAVGLTFDQAAEAITPAACAREERAFLACVNALRQAILRADPGLALDAAPADDRDGGGVTVVARFGALAVIRTPELPAAARTERAEALRALIGRLRAVYADPATREAVPWTALVAWLRREHAHGARESALTAAAFNGYLATAADPFQRLAPTEREDSALDRAGLPTIGVGLFVETQGAALAIFKVVDGGPADAAGLRVGDALTHIDGASLAGMAAAAVQARLDGPEGSRVELRVERAGGVSDRTLVRSAVEAAWVDAGTIVVTPSAAGGGGVHPGAVVGYVGVPTFFSRAICDQVDRAIDLAEARGARAIVLDLRGNAGGLVDQATCVAGIFLPKGSPIARFVPATGEDPGSGAVVRAHLTAREPRTDAPLVALVDHATGSAAELLAGALGDHGRAVVVGARTYGKGSVQVPVEDGQAGVRRWVTAGGWRLPSGRDVHLTGVAPHLRGVAPAGAEALDQPGVELVYLDALTIPAAIGEVAPTTPGAAPEVTSCARARFSRRAAWRARDATGDPTAPADPVAFAVAVASCLADPLGDEGAPVDP